MKVIWHGALMKATAEAMYPTVGALVLGTGVALALQGMWGLTIGKITTLAMILVTLYKPGPAPPRPVPQDETVARPGPHTQAGPGAD